MNLNHKYIRNAPFRKEKNKVIISPGFLLNETASIIWLNCDGKKTLSDIIKKLLRKYDKSANVKEITKDVEEIIKKLKAVNLLK